MTALLEIRGVRAGYDSGDVLQGVDLELSQGEVVALLGRNGVGKTTLMNAIVGLVRPREGSIRLDGVDIAGASTHEIARAGVAIVPQGRRIFTRLTVEENLKLARRATGGRAGCRRRVGEVRSSSSSGSFAVIRSVCRGNGSRSFRRRGVRRGLSAVARCLRGSVRQTVLRG